MTHPLPGRRPCCCEGRRSTAWPTELHHDRAVATTGVRPPTTPEPRNLVFWGTADPAYLMPAATWAGIFGTPNVPFISPRTTTAFLGDTDLTVATWANQRTANRDT
jgi:hypothetical protein